MKRYTDPSSLRKHIKAHGHFVAQEQGTLSRGTVVSHQGHQRIPELPSVGGTHVIVPGAAAALLGGLGTSLPLSAFCHTRSLGHHRSSLFSLGGGGGQGGGMGPLGLSDSSLLHVGAASMLGLGALRGLRLMAGKGGEKEDEGQEGEALNLSTGVEPRQSDPLSWVVVPPRPLFLKPAVVS